MNLSELFQSLSRGKLIKQNLKTVLSASKVPCKQHKGIVEKIVADVLREYPNVKGISVDKCDNIFGGKGEMSSQRSRASMKKHSGAVWYDIQSGIKKASGATR
jgi:hypothetical protein